ncbi:hypothetical protein AALA80_10755 [Oscillospiraceae bacterium 50-60]
METAGAAILAAPAARLSKSAGDFVNGKEGCVRETQEGFPAPLKSSDLQNFLKFCKSTAAC